MLLIEENRHSIRARYRMKPALSMNKFVARLTIARPVPHAYRVTPAFGVNQQ